MTTDPRIAVLAAISSPEWRPVPEAHDMPWDEAEKLLAAYDASQPAPVPSVSADRAAVLREAANGLAALGPLDSLVSAPAAWTEAIETLRRMADEAHQAGDAR